MLYKNFIRPLLFQIDPELVHNAVVFAGEMLGEAPFLNYKSSKLTQKICGITFANPLGLAAGFDYDGHLASTMQSVGFGFNTVGTVTAKPYAGNPAPRLTRLPLSKSILVNKGFKSGGVAVVAKRLDAKDLTRTTLGVSVGSSNLPEIDTVTKAIDDYLFTFDYLKAKKYVSYFELNISCPNTLLTEPFKDPKNLEALLKNLKVKKPVFIKLKNEMTGDEADAIVKIALKYPVAGFVIANLVKDRKNKYLNKAEVARIKDLKGNFSGMPAAENANRLIAHIYKKYGRDCKIIGCGGVFTAADAYEKIKLGASLVEMITGMIYEGPQVAGEINRGLVRLLERDGFKTISDAVGTA